ncbi:hypothetical protein SAMN05444156_1842 [Verrucomicrobium sp. GAS474]|uniref:hypothetical protein n=1 Tax=Verrucomicrobium sp. GAS474 TaxID=1882831 RepID=UPI00087D786A|nr:hypothetical protein [Verrucomicrobium sp. GAS474]SDU08018.1 hypothetical protein SAMN05444156_1842 [Verrucomicrobium sp. GAS474]
MRPALSFWKRPSAVVTALLALGWFALAGAGYPPPNVDDICYAGPAIEVANGHGPMDPWGPYYVEHTEGRATYPPFYAYLLGGWLKVFGVSSPSMLFFYALCGMALTLAIGFFVRRWRLAWWVEVLMTAFIVVCFASKGLRPDLCGMAMFAVGAALEAGEGRWRKGWGTALVVASVFTLPSIAAWAGPFLFYRFGERALAAGIPAACREMLPRLAAIGAALGLLFLWSVGFELRKFLAYAHANALYSVSMYGTIYFDNWTHSLGLFIRMALLTLLSYGVGAVFWAGVWQRTQGVERQRLWLGTAAAAAVSVMLFRMLSVSSTGLQLLNLTSALVLPVFLAVGWLRGRKVLLAVALPAVLAVCVLLPVSYWQFLTWAASPAVDKGRAREIKQEVDALAPALVWVDGYAARYVYDYRLPAELRDFSHDRESYGRWVKASQEEKAARKADTVWILCAGTIPYAEGLENDRRPRPLRFFGRRFPRGIANEGELFLIR